MDRISQRKKAQREIACARGAILLLMILMTFWVAFHFDTVPTVADLLILLVLSCLALAPLFILSRAQARLAALGGPVRRRGAARRSEALAKRNRRKKTTHRLR